MLQDAMCDQQSRVGAPTHQAHAESQCPQPEVALSSLFTLLAFQLSSNCTFHSGGSHILGSILGTLCVPSQNEKVVIILTMRDGILKFTFGNK